MIDKLNRNIEYLRISVTDRCYLRVSVTDNCNLRCVYCMPEEGVENIPHDEILSYDEILKVCKCASKLGIKKIKITGGEPLVRKDIVSLIRDIKNILEMRYGMEFVSQIYFSQSCLEGKEIFDKVKNDFIE